MRSNSGSLCAFALTVNCFLQNNLWLTQSRRGQQTRASRDLSFLPAQMCNVTLCAAQGYFMKFLTISVRLMILISKLGHGAFASRICPPEPDNRILKQRTLKIIIPSLHHSILPLPVGKHP